MQFAGNFGKIIAWGLTPDVNFSYLARGVVLESSWWVQHQPPPGQFKQCVKPQYKTSSCTHTSTDFSSLHAIDQWCTNGLRSFGAKFMLDALPDISPVLQIKITEHQLARQ